MNRKINLPNITKGFLVFGALFIAKHFESEALLFPLFVLGDSTGTGGNCCGNSAGCSGGDSSGSGSCGTGGGSTPFLCTWNGTDFQFENDILFGKPVSLFSTKEAGLAAYEQGRVVGDCYKISNSLVPKDNHIAFQIKEIEPEESFIDHLSLLHVTYPKNGKLIMGSDFKSTLVFDKASLQEKEGIENQGMKDQNGTDISGKFEVFDNTKKDASVHVMENQDVIYVTGKVEDRNNLLYLLIGSHYRDWTLGGVLKSGDTSLVKNRIIDVISESRSVRAIVSGAVKVTALTFLFGVIWISGIAQSIFSFGGNTERFSDASKLANTFGIRSVQADVPFIIDPFGGGGKNSLLVEYLDGDTYHKIDVIQPRCYQKTLEAVLIPSEVIQSSGEVSLRITATRKHDVADLSFVAPKTLLPFEMTTLGVTKAFHRREKRDYTEILNKKDSKEYLHTIPSDIVDVEFGPLSEKMKGSQENEAYLIQAHGFYTPATDESQRIAGDWVSKLDPESRQILSKMYTLADYNKKDRTTVL